MFTALELFKDMTSMQCKSESLLMSERIRFYLSSNIWLSHLNAFTKLALAAFISGWQVSEHREHTVLHTSESLLAVHPLCSISLSMEHMLTVPCTLPVCPAWGHPAAQPSHHPGSAAYKCRPRATQCHCLHQHNKIPASQPAEKKAVPAPAQHCSHSHNDVPYEITSMDKNGTFCDMSAETPMPIDSPGQQTGCLQPGWAEDQLRPPRLPWHGTLSVWSCALSSPSSSSLAPTQSAAFLHKIHRNIIIMKMSASGSFFLWK